MIGSAYATGESRYSNVLWDALSSARFTYSLEIVAPGPDESIESAITPILELARYAKEEPRIGAVAVTDRVRCDHDHDPVEVACRVADVSGREPLVHWAGKDRGRRDLERSLERMERAGLHNVLLVTGDKLKALVRRPVRYYDSVNAIHDVKRLASEFLVGAVVCPFKYREEELFNQYRKLGLKLRAGADLLIAQIGFDMVKFAELLVVLRHRAERVPTMAAVLFLTAARGRYIRRVSLPGVTISDDLQRKLEDEGGQPDGGVSAALYRLALQIIGLRRMGYAGVHLSGLKTAARVEQLLELVQRLEGQCSTLSEWWSAWRESLTHADGSAVSPAPGQGVYLFGAEELSLPVAGSTPSAGQAEPALVEWLKFKALDTLDHFVFQKRSAGAKVLVPLFARVTPGSAADRIFLGIERITKGPLVGCQSCGFCRLPYTAYVCPETCPKGLANGPCGGTRDNLCEFGDWECVHNRQYRLLKAAGRLQELEDVLIPAVPESSRDSCSWVNHFAARSPEVIRLQSNRDRGGKRA